MRYDYDRRVASSATPSFDAIVKNESKINSTLEAGAKRLNSIVTKAEDLAKGRGGPAALAQADAMLDVGTKMFDPFRTVLSKGRSEMNEVGEATFDAAREARNLMSALQGMNKAYASVAQGRQDKNLEAVLKGGHDLAVSVSTVKTIFTQYVRAYRH